MSTGTLPTGHPLMTHESAIPHSVKIFIPKIVKKGLKAVKDRYRINSDQPVYTSDNNPIVRFTLTNDSLLDFKHARLHFDLAVDQPTTVGDQAWTSNPGVFTLFKRARIVSPGVKEELMEMHRWSSLVREALTEEGVANTAASQWGFGSELERRARAQVTTHYQMPIDLGFLARGPLPLDRIKDQIKIEFDLAPVNESLEADSIAGVNRVTLTNVYLEVDQIFSQYIEDMYKNIIASNGLNMGTMGYEWFQLSMAAGSNLYNPPITNRSDAVEDMLVYFQDANFASSMLNRDKFITWQSRGLSTLQIRRKGTYWPTRPLDQNLFYEEFHRICKDSDITGIWRSRTTISVGRYNTDRQLLAIEINPFTSDGLISNEGNSGYTADTVLLLQFAANQASAFEAHCFVRRYVSLFVSTDGHIINASK